MVHQVTLIPGDGIGPEVADATARAVEATGVKIDWERVAAGIGALATYGSLLPDETLASIEATRVGLKGPTATPIAGGHQSINVALRKKFELYVNFLPVRMLPNLATRFSDLPVTSAQRGPLVPAPWRKCPFHPTADLRQIRRDRAQDFSPQKAPEAIGQSRWSGKASGSSNVPRGVQHGLLD